MTRLTSESLPFLPLYYTRKVKLNHTKKSLDLIRDFFKYKNHLRTFVKKRMQHIIYDIWMIMWHISFDMSLDDWTLSKKIHSTCHIITNMLCHLWLLTYYLVIGYFRKKLTSDATSSPMPCHHEWWRVTQWLDFWKIP